MWSGIRPRCAALLGRSIAVAFSNFRSPREYEFATESITHAPTLLRFGQTREFLRRMGFSEGTAGNSLFGPKNSL